MNSALLIEWLSGLLEQWFNSVFRIWATFFAAAWFLMLVSGNLLISRLKALKGTKWSPREDTPDTHLVKAGVPSMGGIGLIGTALLTYSALFGTIVLVEGAQSPNSFEGHRALAGECVFVGMVLLHAVLGLVDDWSKATGRGGLLARHKFAAQLSLAVLFILCSVADLKFRFGGSTSSFVLAALVSILVIVGTSNAVNLTDGIDGLAAGLSVEVSLSVLSLFYWVVWYTGSQDAPVVWACLGGASLGFLAFNRHPAKIFMGDTGSLALGAALGAGAVAMHAVFLLPFIGFIFYLEMFSVIAQVLYFKYTRKRFGEGKRLLRRAPLHHHFELAGWGEWRVVLTFWGINAVTSALGLWLWWRGALPVYP